MSDLRFDQIARGITVDQAAFARDMARLAAPRRCYVVMFSARSGSTWLSRVLAATTCLGRPEEYINPDFIGSVAQACNARTAADLLQSLMRRRQTPNGVFGIEARSVDIDLLGRQAFRDSFAADAVFFHLWRRNLVAQGISLYRAVATSRFHSDSAAGTATPPPYDADQILGWIEHVANAENDNERLLRGLGVARRRIVYEDIVRDRAGTIGLFCTVLGVAPPQAETAGDDLHKIGDAWNEETEARIRRDRPAQIEGFLTSRLINETDPPSVPLEPLEAWRKGQVAGARGGDPAASPRDLLPAAQAAWRQGWRAGWSSPPEPDSGAAALAPPQDLSGAAIADLRQAAPEKLDDLTARHFADLLRDQTERGVAGGLIEIGLSRGRQTRLLLAASDGAAVIGIDLLDGRLAALLRDRLKEPEWQVRTQAMSVQAFAEVKALAGGAARFVNVDCAQAPDQISRALELAESVLAADGVVAISDVLSPAHLRITEAVFRYYAALRRLVPFALLPGRLLLAPPAVAEQYRERVRAAAEAQGDVVGPEQPLFGGTVVVVVG